MSDLAPFVAAHLHDKVLDDLLKENAALRQQVTRTQEIKITGPNGVPVYSKGWLSEGEYGGAGTTWIVDLEPVSECPLALCTSAEVRVGGALWESCSHKHPCCIMDFIIGCYDAKKMGLFEIRLRGSSALSDLMIRAGPFNTMQEYVDAFNLRPTDEFRCWNLSQIGSGRPEMSVKFESMTFTGAKMKDTLENLGINEMERESDDAMSD